MSNIILIGLAGSGKSSIGKILAEKLNYHHIDTDHLIVERYSKSLNNIVNEIGETGFRQIEVKTLENLRQKLDTVISTGGGIILNANNREILSQLGYVVFLEVSHEIQLERLQQCKDRPFLQKGNKEETLKTMRKKRQSIYEGLADFKIDTSKKAFEDVAIEIIASFTQGG